MLAKDAYVEGEGEGRGVEDAYASAVPVPGAAPAAPRGGESQYQYGAQTQETADDVARGKVAFEKAQSAVFSNGGWPLVVFMSSLVLLIAASSNCSDQKNCSSNNGYAVAAGVISLVISFVFLFLERKETLQPTVRLGMTVFLFVWWVLVAGICTFSGPFSEPGNGYFAAWGGLVASLYMLMNEVGKVRDAIDKFSAVGQKIGILLVGSLVVMFASIGACRGGCSGNASYGIAVGAISFSFTLARVLLESKIGENVLRIFNLFMVVWWLIAFFVLTFFGPFLKVGNGYFGTWACLFASLLLIKN